MADSTSLPDDDITPASESEDQSEQTINDDNVDAVFAGNPPAAEDLSASGPDEGVTLQQQLDDANERVLRSQADLENFRRRARREMEDVARYGGLPLMQDLLPVLDNLERAIESANKETDVSGLLDGIQMVANQLKGALARHHCESIAAVGETFDPNMHEAISQMPSDEHPAGTVMHEAVPGYRLHDRVVRASQVIVAAGSPTKSTASDEEE